LGVTTLPLMKTHGAQYFTVARQTGLDILSPHRVREQEKALRAGLRFPNPARRPYVARDDIERFVY
jgi:hypothetical protein